MFRTRHLPNERLLLFTGARSPPRSPRPPRSPYCRAPCTPPGPMDSSAPQAHVRPGPRHTPPRRRRRVARADAAAATAAAAAAEGRVVLCCASWLESCHARPCDPPCEPPPAPPRPPPPPPPPRALSSRISGSRREVTSPARPPASPRSAPPTPNPRPRSPRSADHIAP